MPWGVAAGVVGSVASSAISSAMAPSGGGGSGSYYTPGNQAGQDINWNDIQQQLMNTYEQTGLNQYGQSSLNAGVQAGNTYGPQLQQYANQAGQQYANLGQQLQGASGLDFGAQQGLLNAGQQAYQTALDPQSALYNRSVQQLQDQTGATNSMYGLGSSAAGAGVANQALGNFNIDWQNQQLQRQLAGLQGYGQAAGQAGQLAGQGGSLGAAGASATQQAGSVPYTTALQNAGLAGQLGNAYGQYLNQNVYGPGQQLQNQSANYLGLGQAAQTLPYQNAYNNAQATGGAFGSAIQGLGNNAQFQQGVSGLFGGNSAGGSFGGGDFSGAFSSNPYYSGGGNQYGFTSGSGGGSGGYGFTMQ